MNNILEQILPRFYLPPIHLSSFIFLTIIGIFFYIKGFVLLEINNMLEKILPCFYPAANSPLVVFYFSNNKRHFFKITKNKKNKKQGVCITGDE
jgi:hypothetical protein